MSNKRVRAGALGLFFVLMAIVMIRPTRWDSFRDNLGDPALVTWLIAWPGRALTSDPTSLFQAPLFWPNGDTYAYSDILVTQSGPFWAFYALTGSWTAAAILLGLTLTVLAQVGAYLLALRIVGRRDAALVAAVSFAFSGYALGRWASPQLSTIGLVALAVVALLRLLEKPSSGRAVLLAISSVAVFYGSLYYGAIWIMLLGATSAAVLGFRLLKRSSSARRLGLNLVLAGALTSAGIAPGAFVLFRLQHDLGLKRPLVPEFDLQPRDLLRPADGSYVWSGLLDSPSPPGAFEHRFYPGAVAIALGAIGTIWILVCIVRRRSPSPSPRAAVDLAIVVAMGAVAFALARGASGFGPVSPWRFVHQNVPGFSGIRAASRLAVPAMLAGSVVAAVGYGAVARRWLRSSGAAVIACAVVLVAMSVDLAAAGRWARLDTSSDALAVYRKLSDKPPGAVLELPMPDPVSQGNLWALVESPRLLYSALDWHPRVNGYSGFVPPGYLDDVEAAKRFPDPASLDRLRERRVRYVVLHVGSENGIPAYTEQAASEVLSEMPPAARVERAGAAYLVDLG